MMDFVVRDPEDGLLTFFETAADAVKFAIYSGAGRVELLIDNDFFVTEDS